MDNNDKEYELNKIEFEKSLALRNFEIENFWKRGWFFGALMLALIAGYFKLKDSSPDYCIYISFVGFLVSMAQSLMNRGSKYWQERWEYKTKNRESILGIDITKTKKINNERYYIDACIQAKNENWFTRSRRISVSKLTFLVWDILSICWLMIWIKECFGLDECIWDGNFFHHHIYLTATFCFHATIVAYILVFFFAKKATKFLFVEKNKKIKITKWLIWLIPIKLKEGGGGKVYESFAKKDDEKISDTLYNEFSNDCANYERNHTT